MSVILSSCSCHFGKNLPFSLYHHQSSRFWCSPLDCTSPYIYPPCRTALFLHSVNPSWDGGITKELGSVKHEKWLHLSNCSFPRFLLFGMKILIKALMVYMLTTSLVIKYAISQNHPKPATTTQNQPQPAKTSHNQLKSPKNSQNHPQPAKSTHS